MSFPSILRRSKFVSYDPAISQVYTTSPANAHRGIWGVKRPLAIRRPQSFITITAVDSRHQQTEWSLAEGQARLIRRWDELGVDARYSDSSNWVKRVGATNVAHWHVDSDFAPHSDSQSHALDTQTVPNIHAMSPKEFERYLKKLRALRPAFKAFVEDRADSKPLFEQAQQPLSEHHKLFLARTSAARYADPSSRAIEQQPHRTGGLSYAHPSPLETLLTTTAQPGLVLQRNPDRSPSSRRGSSHMRESLFASYAGFLAHLLREDAAARVPALNLNSPAGVRPDALHESTTRLRVRTKPRLTSAPRVVGRTPDKLTATRLEVDVTSDDKTNFSRSNPHIPGSRPYITVEPQQPQQMGGRARAKPMSLVGNSRGRGTQYDQNAYKLMQTITDTIGKRWYSSLQYSRT